MSSPHNPGPCSRNPAWARAPAFAAASMTAFTACRRPPAPQAARAAHPSHLPPHHRKPPPQPPTALLESQ